MHYASISLQNPSRTIGGGGQSLKRQIMALCGFVYVLRLKLCPYGHKHHTPMFADLTYSLRYRSQIKVGRCDQNLTSLNISHN